MRKNSFTNYTKGGTDMKKALLTGMALITAAALCSCGGSKPAETTTAAAQTTAAAAQQAQTDTAAAPSGSAGSESRAIINDGSKVGVLQEFPGQDVLKIKGLIVNTGSGHHEYDSIETLYSKGYKTSGLNSEYYMNEWIEIYADTNDKGFAIYAAKNDPDKDYSEITVAELQKNLGGNDLPYCEVEEGADKENYGFIASFYIHPDYNEPGLYNVFFTKGGKVAYMVQLTLIPESN